MILVTDLKTLESGSCPSEFEEELKQNIKKLIMSAKAKLEMPQQLILLYDLEALNLSKKKNAANV